MSYSVGAVQAVSAAGTGGAVYGPAERALYMNYLKAIRARSSGSASARLRAEMEQNAGGDRSNVSETEKLKSKEAATAVQDVRKLTPAEAIAQVYAARDYLRR